MLPPPVSTMLQVTRLSAVPETEAANCTVEFMAVLMPAGVMETAILGGGGAWLLGVRLPPQALQRSAMGTTAMATHSLGIGHGVLDRIMSCHVRSGDARSTV